MTRISKIIGAASIKDLNELRESLIAGQQLKKLSSGLNVEHAVVEDQSDISIDNPIVITKL